MPSGIKELEIKQLCSELKALSAPTFFEDQDAEAEEARLNDYKSKKCELENVISRIGINNIFKIEHIVYSIWGIFTYKEIYIPIFEIIFREKVIKDINEPRWFIKCNEKTAAAYIEKIENYFK